MGGLIRLILMLGIIGYGVYATYQRHNHPSEDSTVTQAEAASAPAAAAQAAPAPAAPSTIVSGANAADNKYLSTYVTSVANSSRGWPFGSTVQNISLPSGRTAALTITKTKTGWCPIRQEPTYDISFKVDVK